MVDQELVNKVLESLSLNVKSVSMIKEINQIDQQIEILNTEHRKIEEDKRIFLKAQEAAIRNANIAKQAIEELNKKLDEIDKITDKAFEAEKEALRYATITQQPTRFDEKMNQVNTVLSEANEIKKGLVKDLNEVKMLREELKKQGVDIDLNKKQPNNVSM